MTGEKAGKAKLKHGWFLHHQTELCFQEVNPIVKKTQFLVILLLVSLALNGFAMIRIDRLGTEFAQAIREMDVRFEDQLFILQAQLNQDSENEPVRDVSYGVGPGDVTAEQVPLTISWTFKSRQSESRVFLRFRTVADSPNAQAPDWQQVPAAVNGLNAFSAALLLDPDEAYQYQIYESGTSEVLTRPQYIPKSYYVRADVRVSGGGKHSPWQGGWKYFDLLLTEEPLQGNAGPFRIAAVTGWGIHADGTRETLTTERDQDNGGWLTWRMVLIPNQTMKMFEEVWVRLEYEDGYVREKDITGDLQTMLAAN